MADCGAALRGGLRAWLRVPAEPEAVEHEARVPVQVPDRRRDRLAVPEDEAAAPLPEAGRATPWQEFRHDTNVATQSLLYLLAGIHAIHESQLQVFARIRDDHGGALGGIEEYARVHGNMHFVPPWPNLLGFLWLNGEPLHERAAPDGPMEQYVFKAWVVEVFDHWESRYRTKLERQFREQLPDACGLIRPEQEVLGDLRHIRNNGGHRKVRGS